MNKNETISQQQVSSFPITDFLDFQIYSKITNEVISTVSIVVQVCFADADVVGGGGRGGKE